MYDATLSTIPLKEIATTQPIYKGEDDEGRLDFRTNLCILDANYARYHFVGAPLVALGLTEICRKIGKGRVCGLLQLVHLKLNGRSGVLASETGGNRLHTETERYRGRLHFPPTP